MSISDDGTTAVPDPSSDGPARPSLLAWQEELNASAGFRAIALMNYVRRIGYLFQANVKQYNALVRRMQDPTFALPILGVSNPGAHDDLLSEAERLLHNVLTALSTRIDQQRAFMRKHFTDDKIMSEYSSKIATVFAADVPSKFLKELRNHMTHHLLPVAQSRQRISSQSFSFTFILPSGPLLEWKWSKDVREWIADQGDEVTIIEVVDSYARKAGDFDKWLHGRIQHKYVAEIREYESAAEAFNREHDRVFGL